MNLPDFLQEVDRVTATCSQEQLAATILELARNLPEGQRAGFLRTVRAGARRRAKKAVAGPDDVRKELEKACQESMKRLEQIEGKELALTVGINQDLRTRPREEFRYGDPQGVLKILGETARLIHRCVDSGAPDLAASLGSRFLEVDVWLEGDFGECFLSIPRAFAVRKEKFDYRGVVLDTAWAVSQTAPGDALWVVHILGLLGNTPSLKTILRHAKAKPEALSSFLPGWMDCVGGRADEQGVRLYEEALDLIPSQQERASYVRKFGEVHPEGYLLLLNRKDLTAEERYSLGMEALDRIGAEYRVRADVALKTADLALELEKGADAAEKCWLAAFESDTNGENWLRVFLNSRNPEESREKMKAVLENLPAEVRPEPGPEYPYRKRNCPSRNMRYALRFLQGEFLPVLQEAMTGKPSLGWSKTFLKQGYALYLSAIYEGPDLPECVADLYRDAEWALNFDPARYRRGLAPSQVEDDALFETCFRQWRTTAVWPEGAKEKILTRLEKRMEKRTEAIVKAGKVVCYRECARYAAAIGETWESLGKQGAKNRILNFYGRNFPRRRDLKAALRGYGWQG